MRTIHERRDPRRRPARRPGTADASLTGTGYAVRTRSLLYADPAGPGAAMAHGDGRGMGHGRMPVRRQLEWTEQ